MKPEEDVIAIACGKCNFKDGKYVCYDNEWAVRCFWGLNVTKNMKMFDFDTNLDNMKGEVDRKLTEHGLRGWQEYKELMEDMYYGRNCKRSELAIKQDAGYVWIDEAELMEVEKKCIAEIDDIPVEEVEIWEDEINEYCKDEVYEHISDRLAEGYGDVEEFELMGKISKEIDSIGSLSLSEKVKLFDKTIHLAHLTGTVFDMDISEMRRDFEKDIST